MPHRPDRPRSNFDDLSIGSPLWQDAHAPAPFHRGEDPGSRALADVIIAILLLAVVGMITICIAAWRGGAL